MSVNFREGDYAPYGKCLYISNDCCEAVVTLDLGPRIISFKALGGENFMFNDVDCAMTTVHPSITEAYGREVYKFYGGHRLWWTPERIPETYFPDDDPVACDISGNTVTLTPPPQPSGVQLIIEVTLDADKPVLTIAQKVINTSGETRRHAAWGITQCRAGGVAVAPQNTRECSPLANRMFVHWCYNDMLDKRFNPGAKYITLRQDTTADRAFKYGFNNEAGWCGYAIDGQLLYKEFGFDAAAVYPDYGCNFESYTNDVALEIESLSGELDLAPGAAVSLTETWTVLPLACGKDMPAAASAEFDAAIDAAISGK